MEAPVTTNEMSMHLSKRHLASWMYRQIYMQILAVDESSQELEIDSLAFSILDLGALFHATSMCPSLVSMEVPFGIRREFYESHERFGDMIHAALNHRDHYFNLWTSYSGYRGLVASCNKADIARALWKWYYTVFEPVAVRFSRNGSEHMINILK